MSTRYDSYQQTYQKPRWDSILNAGLDKIGDDVDALETAQTSLNTLVTNWVTTENYLIYCTATPTYVDGDTFTVPGDFTGSFAAGRVIQVDNGPTDGMLMTTVTSSSHVAGTTTVELDDAVLTANLARLFFVASRDGLTLAQSGMVYAADYGTPGQTAFDAALAAIGINDRILVLGPGDWERPTSDIPANVTLLPLMGALIDPAATDLTIGKLATGICYQIFSPSGAGKILFDDGAVDRIAPECWGAAGDDSTDCTDAIQAALDSGAPVITFGYGIYQSDAVTMPATGVRLEGASRTKTVIYGLNGSGDYLITYNDTTQAHRGGGIARLQISVPTSGANGVKLLESRGFIIYDINLIGAGGGAIGLLIDDEAASSPQIGSTFNTVRDAFINAWSDAGIRLDTQGALTWCNANNFMNISVNACGIGIDLVAAQTNYFASVYTQNCTTGLKIGAAASYNDFFGYHSEYDTVSVDLSASPGQNRIVGTWNWETTLQAASALDWLQNNFGQQPLPAIDRMRFRGYYRNIYAVSEDFATGAVSTANDEITVTRSFTTGTPVQFTTTGTLPAGLSLATTYYTIRVDATTIQLASSYANSIQVDRAASQNISDLSRAAACVVTWTGHGLSNGDQVVMSGITQADWTVLNSNVYAITKIGDDSFSIPVDTSGIAAAYVPGTDPGVIVKKAIDITSQGSGTHTITISAASTVPTEKAAFYFGADAYALGPIYFQARDNGASGGTATNVMALIGGVANPYAQVYKPMSFSVLTAEPATKTTGMVVRADRSTWDPLSKGSGGSYFCWWNGSAWKGLHEQ